MGKWIHLGLSQGRQTKYLGDLNHMYFSSSEANVMIMKMDKKGHSFAMADDRVQSVHGHTSLAAWDGAHLGRQTIGNGEMEERINETCDHDKGTLSELKIFLFWFPWGQTRITRLANMEIFAEGI